MASLIQVVIVISFLLGARAATASLCDPKNERCWNYGRGRSSSAPANPSTGSAIKINPSAVPTQDAIGGEVIYFADSFDFALVKGTGRVGAAISPSNGEETYFGPPGFEEPDTYLDRKKSKSKFSSRKIALATAFNVFSNNKQGLKRVDLNVGVMGKYHRDTQSVWPGAGINGIAGPITFGYSVTGDESLLVNSAAPKIEPYMFRYSIETYSIGMYLTSVAVDYSLMQLYSAEAPTMTVRLLTASLFLSRWIVTASSRVEDSFRPAYDWETGSLVYEQEKHDVFFGAQFSATKNVLVGAFYNYYLLREISIGLTVFF